MSDALEASLKKVFDDFLAKMDGPGTRVDGLSDTGLSPAVDRLSARFDTLNEMLDNLASVQRSNLKR